MIAEKAKRVKRRPNPKAYFPHNSKCVAGMRFGDTLRSVRGKAGILRRAGAIAWNAGVIERAAADGITQLEVQIRGGATYTTSLQTLLQNGQIQYRDGRQWVLSLRYWSIDGQAAEASQSEDLQAIQHTLFEVQNEQC